MYSNGIYLYYFKIQSLQIYDTIFQNFTYVDQKKQDGYIMKIVQMDLYPSMIWNTLFKSVSVIQSEPSFLLFWGYNAVNTLSQSDKYLVQFDNLTIEY
ncbi:UNKNOWN [Stylonychia lemnae]|uniref:Uncharacterized protein n=1 Tax=Stylonychia lemnae TaxID=5949 RepID=A0A077ZX31_STYLE|nr:UNKNOWN [Stylonychia lemnae]|eukprot:CDW74476.1 UNKNOWN [Stylonychia lemnae]